MNTIRTWKVCTLALAMACAGPAFAQRAYPTAEAAGDALVDALGTTKADTDKLGIVLGANWKDYVPEGSVDRKDVDAFLAKYREQHKFLPTASGRMMLAAGQEGWTFPVPLTKGDGGWHFDLEAGKDEILSRRIGRNELDVHEAVLAYHDAQMDYAESDHDGDGVLEYAQQLVSTDGKHDGLYWADDSSGQISPLGPLFGDDKPKGDYLGYRYKILKAQGDSAPGGPYGYMLGQDMSRGFALVAWPAQYGETGVMTVMVGPDGQVFERDLGKDTEDVVRAMGKYDPDSAWKEVSDKPVASK